MLQVVQLQLGDNHRAQPFAPAPRRGLVRLATGTCLSVLGPTADFGVVGIEGGPLALIPVPGGSGRVVAGGVQQDLQQGVQRTFGRGRCGHEQLVIVPA